MIGQRLLHYEIIEKLGEGGMGVVYRARDTHLDRFVALKVLPPEKVSDPTRKARFIQEAKAASALNHANIVTVHDIGSDAGTDFIVMEYVAGKTLDQLVSRKGMRLNDALKIALQIASALARAHSAGIVHRDLKPSNVIVDDHGSVKLLDFGLAKLVEADTSGDATTATVGVKTEEGTVVGTAAYMSPEQAQGHALDARSDIFSFGAVLYEMLAGHHTFQGSSRISVLSAVLQEEPAPLAADVPYDLRKLVERCLHKDVARRIQHMDDAKIVLEELKEDSDSGKLRMVPAVGKPRRPTMAMGAGAVLALLAISAAAWWGLMRKTPPSAAVLRPLTSDPGREYHPSFSPDGRQVVYAWEGEQQRDFDIYVRIIGGDSRLRLTTNEADEYSPVWSPDGRWIAFQRTLPAGRDGIYLMSPLGGSERKLIEAITPGLLWIEIQGPYLSWSPDSKWLVYPDRSAPGQPYGLSMISIETLEKRRTTAPAPPSFGDQNAAISPDGRKLVFVRQPSWGSGDLYVLPLTTDFQPGGEPRKLMLETRYSTNVAWMSDSEEILFVSGSSFLDTGLWRSRVSGAGKPERLQAFGTGLRFLAASHQAGRVAFARISVDTNIWGVALHRSPGKPIPPTRLIASTRVDWTPDFSPDGKKISFISERSGSFEIWVSNSDGSNPAPLVSLGAMFTIYTRWSPDGSRIAFCSTLDGQRDIFVIDAHGGQPRRLTNHPGHDSFPRWSLDGKSIYFSSMRSGSEEIWKMPAEGGAPGQVTTTGGLLAAESPDGRHLYYVKGRGVTPLWKSPIDGGPETQVLPGIYWLDFAVAKDGIYFCRPDQPRYLLEFLSFATGRTEFVSDARSGVFGMAVSPDGRSLIYAQADGYESDLMLVENFR